jgi:hypothetical protein
MDNETVENSGNGVHETKKVKRMVIFLAGGVIFLVITSVIIVMLMYNNLANQKMAQQALAAVDSSFTEQNSHRIQTEDIHFMTLNDKQDTSLNYLRRILRKPSFPVAELERIINTSDQKTRTVLVDLINGIKSQNEELGNKMQGQLKDALELKAENATLQDKINTQDSDIRTRKENNDRLIKSFFTLADEKIKAKDYKDAKLILLRLQSARLDKKYNDLANAWIEQCDAADKTTGFWSKLTGKEKKPEVSQPNFSE